MSARELAQQIHDESERIHAFYRSAGPGGHVGDPVYEQSLEELSTALEELRAAEDELNRQNLELALAAETLEAERQRYQDLFEGAPDGYVVTDAHSTIREANRAVGRMLGVEPKFLIGKPLVSFVAEDDRRAVRTLLHDLTRDPARGSDPGQVEIVMRPRQADPFHAGISVAVERPAAGAASLRWLVRDITERKRIEEATLALNAELDRRVAERTTELEAANQAKDLLIAQEQEARLGLERAQSRLLYLIGAGGILGSSLDYTATLHRVARLAVPYVADGCIVDLVEEDGTYRTISVAHADPDKAALIRELERRYPADADARHGAARVLRTGLPDIVPEVTEALINRIARDEEHRRILRALDIRSAMIVPLQARGQILGALTLLSSDPRRRYGKDDRIMAEGLAQRAAVALDNARLHRQVEQARDQQSAIAETLQKSFLPDLPIDMPELEIGELYCPAHERSLVGGDFYDLFPMGQDRYGVVLGDVSGKGVEAAVTTAMTKYTLRGFAAEFERPEVVVARLDRLLYQQLPDDRFVTLFFGVLDLRERSLCYASAGHETLLIERPDGRMEMMEATGPVLGALKGNVHVDRAMSLTPGSSLLLFTDGLTEARREGCFLGVDGVAELFRATRGRPARERVQRLLEGCQEFSGGPLRDDAALLLVRLPMEGGGPLPAPRAEDLAEDLAEDREVTGSPPEEAAVAGRTG